MDRFVGCAIVAASLLGVAEDAVVQTPLRDETTVYMVSCDGKSVGGVCHGMEQTDVPFTYQAFVDQQSVRYWRADDSSQSYRFPICAVHDAKNWLCQLESNAIPKSRFAMVAGKFVEMETCATTEHAATFYQVPVWRWWLVRMREKLA